MRNQLKNNNNKILINNNENLLELYEQTLKTLREKEILLKEIHHRLNNNLQLIISLLHIEVQNESNQSVDVFLEKSESRIKSISLIHQNLYHSQCIGSIDFQVYLENLIQSILNVNQEKANSILISVNANNLNFNTETAIPLGLIINELINNSLKYAFLKKHAGEIKISLLQLNEIDFELNISDNGIGFKVGHISNDAVGLELVSLLVLQLNGEMKKIDCPGTLYSVRFQKII